MTVKESSAFLKRSKRSLREECFGEQCSFEEVREVHGNTEYAVSINIYLNCNFGKWELFIIRNLWLAIFS